MPRYLDPKIDLAFKRVFGEHAHLLKSFLNAMLPLPDDGQIESLQYLTPEQVPDIPGLLKNSIVDVKCTDTQGRIFIVEMQMLWTPSFTNRIVFSASQAYVKQLKSGEHYRALQPVYALALLNDRFDLKTAQFYHHYQIVNVQNSDEKLQGLEFVIVELPKFKASPQLALRAARRMQTLWLRFLSEIGDDAPNVAEELASDGDIAQALELVEVGAFTTAELDSYHSGLDRVRVEQTYIADAEAKGMEKGMEKGEAQALTRLVKAMHASGMPLAQIAAIAKLGVAEVAEVVQKL